MQDIYQLRDFVVKVLFELAPFDIVGAVSFDVPVKSPGDSGDEAVLHFSVDQESFNQKFAEHFSLWEDARPQSGDADPT